MELTDHRGDWFLPDKPNDRVAGLLEFNPEEGGTLELIGAFDERPVNRSREVDLIYGVNTDGKRITLYDCIINPSGFSTADTRFQTQTCRAQKLFIGAHFSEDQIELDKIAFTVPYLGQWMEQTALVNPEDDPTGTRMADLDPIETQVDGTDIRLNVVPSVDMQRYEEVKYSQTVRVIVDPNASMTFDEYLNQYIRHMVNFFTLGLGMAVGAVELIGCVVGDDTTKTIEIEFLRSQYVFPAEKPHVNQINFTLHDIEFATAIQNWFESAHVSETLHDRYFLTVRKDDMVIENQFLSLIIGLETHHRRKNPNLRFMSNSLYQRTVRQMLRRMPNVAAKERIGNLLRSGMGNEYSLRDRLEDVTSEYEAVLTELMDVDDTVKAARDLRHNLAHGLDEDFEFNELTRITYRLRAIVLVHFLYLLEVDEDTITKTIRRKYGHHL